MPHSTYSDILRFLTVCNPLSPHLTSIYTDTLYIIPLNSPMRACLQRLPSCPRLFAAWLNTRKSARRNLRDTMKRTSLYTAITIAAIPPLLQYICGSLRKKKERETYSIRDTYSIIKSVYRHEREHSERELVAEQTSETNNAERHLNISE